ncbi:MAG: hypothetical protein M3268_08860 [Acidobacteriota bacterium]|nr:hypothetical protein [Acidobacteriota bacterium]
MSSTAYDTFMRLLYCAGFFGLGAYFLLHGFSRELRQRRSNDPEDRPVIRSDRVDGLVQIACFVLGGLFLAAGILFVVVLIFVGP